ncbi:hypothetical protein ABIA33_007114 [Streptacidiphilus sp. MAP12-16]|uniref:hypothetical protein n=1 Tax=Streptacidiphilus sp. MAP12-16 TaxID=3156300 RepID=UPI003516BDB4
MALQPGTPEYREALAALTTVLTVRAQTGNELYTYKQVALLLQDLGHPVHWRGSTLSLLLGDLCRQEAAKGAPMLSAIVVNAPVRYGKPSQRFFDLAGEYPFNRGEGWTWEQERERVFDYYSQAA